MSVTLSLRRRIAIGVGAIAVAAVGPTISGLEAGAVPATTLGSVNASALATGIRAPMYSHQGQDAEAEVPFAHSELGAGGVGHALTSVFWPGSTGGSLGSTLGVLGVSGLPPSIINLLNDPYKAEAPTTTGEMTVAKSSPGVTMEAVAKPTHVSATSAIGVAGGKSANLGTITATTNVQVNGNTAVIDAKSAITDISVAGVLTIGSLVSTAHATTNGEKATGTTQTQIADVKVAGIGVTIDQNGVELSGKSLLPASVIATLSKTVNTALKQAGIQIYIAKKTRQIKGPQVSLYSGDLIIAVHKPGYRSGLNDTGTLLELGGATINANASTGYVPPAITPSSTPASTSPTGGGTGSTGTGTGGSAVPSFTPPNNLPGSGLSTPPVTAPKPSLAAKPLPLPGAISSWWVVGGVALAVLIALALTQLPGRLLAAGGAACGLEEDR